MIYTKPANLSYTDIAIWIDENSSLPDCDEGKLYEYLYHLANMLAHKGNYFESVDAYDQFSLYSASKLFMRLRTCNQNLPKLKSILNYIKAVIYPYKVDFDKEFVNEASEDLYIEASDTQDIGMYLLDETDYFNKIDFNMTLGNISSIIKYILHDIPKERNSGEWDNIYISCLLTLLDNITPDSPIDSSKIDIRSLDNMYKKLNMNNPILYHLDNSYSDYIKLLTRKIKHALAKYLSIEESQYMNVEVSIKNILIANARSEDT